MSMMESYKGKDWIETYTGRQFKPMQPDPSGFCLLDMAHSLALKCRYNGHTQRFYSVAEHCCHMANHAWNNGARHHRVILEILTHDCSETYFPDVCRPLKQFCPELVAAEKVVGAMIREWLHLDGPVPDIVHELDSRIIVDERRDVMADSPHNWSTDVLQPLGTRIVGWSPEDAERNWLQLTSQAASLHLGRPVYWQRGDAGQPTITDRPHARIRDIVQADILGGAGVILVRDERGMMERDREVGDFPWPKTEFLHGQFELAIPQT